MYEQQQLWCMDLHWKWTRWLQQVPRFKYIVWFLLCPRLGADFLNWESSANEWWWAQWCSIISERGAKLIEQAPGLIIVGHRNIGGKSDCQCVVDGGCFSFIGHIGPLQCCDANAEHIPKRAYWYLVVHRAKCCRKIKKTKHRNVIIIKTKQVSENLQKWCFSAVSRYVSRPKIDWLID